MAKQYFKRGAQIEISSNEDDFTGSWYAGTVIRPPMGKYNKTLVEYATLLEEGPGRRPLRELLDLVQLRPAPPPENRTAFKFDEFVDAYHNDGWWEGFVTRVVGVDQYTVIFPTKEELTFRPHHLRLHRDWVEEDDGTWQWDPPLKEKEDTPTTTDQTTFSSDMEVCGDAVEGDQFKTGEEVEVSMDDEGFKGAWFGATVIKVMNGGKYVVEYERLMSDDEKGLLREEVSGVNMRPSPPDIGLVDRFDVEEEVDAWYNDAWWVGSIAKVLKNDRYTVYFPNTEEELKLDHIKLRVHQDWKNGKWHIASKVLKT